MLNLYRNKAVNDSGTKWLSGTLPIIFVPSFTVSKLKAMGRDYKAEFLKLGMNSMFTDKWLFNSNDDKELQARKNDVNEFMKLVGTDEALLIEVLNKYMGRDKLGVSRTHPIQTYINFALNENDYNRILTSRLFPSLSSNQQASTKPYEIVIDKDAFFIIMNANAFQQFDLTQKKLSRELCESLLGFVDESFVFQSVFYKSL